MERFILNVLIVSANESLYNSVAALLPRNEFSLYQASSSGEAKRMLVSALPDIMIVNTPLPDDFGIELAMSFADTNSCILLLVKNEYYDQVCYKVEKSGVLTLGKPASKQGLYSAIRLLCATHMKLSKLEKKNRTLQEKMSDIRTVNRAKWLLIENMNMTEKDAHYYIEKQAMDTRLSRREIAEHIIRTYDK